MVIRSCGSAKSSVAQLRTNKSKSVRCTPIGLYILSRDITCVSDSPQFLWGHAGNPGAICIVCPWAEGTLKILCQCAVVHKGFGDWQAIDALAASQIVSKMFKKQRVYCSLWMESRLHRAHPMTAEQFLRDHISAFQVGVVVRLEKMVKVSDVFGALG